MADVLSRCCALNEIPQSRVDGPQFLSSHKSDWSIEIPHSDKLLDLDPEIKKVAVECAEAIVHTLDEQPLDINDPVTGREIKIAEAVLVKHVQSTCY